jgi:hypothetical protein
MPLDYMTSSRGWIFGGCYDKKQIPCKNKCGTENEGGGVPSESIVFQDIAQRLRIPLGNNYG